MLSSSKHADHFFNNVSMSETGSGRDSFRWMILALISFSHVIGAAAQYGINTLAPFYQQDLQLSRAQIGLFFTAFYLGMAALSFVAGWLADRLGVRITVLVGHVAVGLCTMAVSLAPSFAWAFGMVITLNSLGAIFGTPLFGYLVDVTGSYSIAWLALAGTVLTGILVLVFFFQEPRVDPSGSQIANLRLQI